MRRRVKASITKPEKQHGRLSEMEMKNGIAVKAHGFGSRIPPTTPPSPNPKVPQSHRFATSFPTAWLFSAPWDHASSFGAPGLRKHGRILIQRYQRCADAHAGRSARAALARGIIVGVACG